MANLRNILAGASMVLALAAQGTARGEEPGHSATIGVETGVEAGRELYVNHCAVCHGLDGRGQGPLATAMKITPADLTRIASEHAGDFPDAKIADVIRNGGAVLGHGSRAMLPWGLYFSERHKPEVGKARIKALVDYIKSLQAKP
jgi:mono/diheme cytochrome c family protein